MHPRYFGGSPTTHFHARQGPHLPQTSRPFPSPLASTFLVSMSWDDDEYEVQLPPSIAVAAAAEGLEVDRTTLEKPAAPAPSGPAAPVQIKPKHVRHRCGCARVEGDWRPRAALARSPRTPPAPGFRSRRALQRGVSPRCGTAAARAPPERHMKGDCHSLERLDHPSALVFRSLTSQHPPWPRAQPHSHAPPTLAALLTLRPPPRPSFSWPSSSLAVRTAGTAARRSSRQTTPPRASGGWRSGSRCVRVCGGVCARTTAAPSPRAPR